MDYWKKAPHFSSLISHTGRSPPLASRQGPSRLMDKTTTILAIKKYLLLGVCGLLATTTLAQHSPQVPTPVLQVFAKVQPQAVHVA
jgi:hypothetical protein